MAREHACGRRAEYLIVEVDEFIVPFPELELQRPKQDGQMCGSAPIARQAPMGQLDSRWLRCSQVLR